MILGGYLLIGVLTAAGLLWEDLSWRKREGLSLRLNRDDLVDYCYVIVFGPAFCIVAVGSILMLMFKRRK